MKINRKAMLAALLAAVMSLTACAGGESSTVDNGSSSSVDNTSAPDVSQDTSDKTEDTQPVKPEEPEEPEAPEESALPPSVQFSKQGGIYEEGFELTISPLEEGEIYYTTDGSDPAKSDTAQVYSAPLEIADRKGDKNVVSAVEPVLIAGSYNKPNSDRNGFVSELSAPDDDAVDKCTVIRAAVKLADGTFAGTASSTYFIGTPEEHIEGIAESCAAAGSDLAVISISMDYDDLFDSEKGIYVKGDIFDESLEEFLEEERRVRDGEKARQLDANYKQRGREWEREATVTMFEFNENGAREVINQNCGIRIQGNYSRSDVQKGLRLYARSEYGAKNFKYAVFGEEHLNDSGEVVDKFKTLVLRAGGNCAFTSKYNDTYWQSLMEGSAVETKKSRPCVVYLNGEYWGLYVLEEDYTDDFMEDIHGVDKDTVVIYKGDAETYEIGYKLDEGELPEGASEDYYFEELLEFFDTHSDLKSQNDFDQFAKLVDTDSVMDYFAAQIWVNNKWDWPGKNWSMWKTTEVDPQNPYADGRWRFMFYDVEFGGVSGGGDAGTNTIKDDKLLEMDTHIPAARCYAYLMTNESWRQEFYDRLLGLSEGEFEKTAALERLSEFEDIYSPLFDQFFERYPETGSTEGAIEGGYASSRCIRDFVSERSRYIQRMIDWCEKTLN